MSRIIISSQARQVAGPQTLPTVAGPTAVLSNNSPSACTIQVDGASYRGYRSMELESFVIFNTFDSYNVGITLDEQGVGVFNTVIAGWNTFTGFASQLKAALDAAGTQVYTVTYTPLPATALGVPDSITISAPSNFRFNFTNEVNSPNFTQSFARMIGLRPQIYAPSYQTPYALSISSEVPAILESHKEILISLQQTQTIGQSFGPVPSAASSVLGYQNRASSTNFSFSVAVDRGKRALLSYAPNKSQRQVIPINDSNPIWNFTVDITGLDGYQISRMPDWTMTLLVRGDEPQL